MCLNHKVKSCVVSNKSMYVTSLISFSLQRVALKIVCLTLTAQDTLQNTRMLNLNKGGKQKKGNRRLLAVILNDSDMHMPPS